MVVVLGGGRSHSAARCKQSWVAELGRRSIDPPEIPDQRNDALGSKMRNARSAVKRAGILYQRSGIFGRDAGCEGALALKARRKDRRSGP